jgi:hypothetical protein
MVYCLNKDKRKGKLLLFINTPLFTHYYAQAEVIS